MEFRQPETKEAPDSLALQRARAAAAMRAMDVSFSLHKRPEFQACSGKLAESIMRCAEPGMAAEALLKAGGALPEAETQGHDRLKFYSEAAPGIADGISRLPPERQEAAFKMIAEAGGWIARSKAESIRLGWKHYWVVIAPNAAKFLSGSTAAAFADIAKAAGKDPGLAASVFSGVSGWETRAKVMQNDEFRRFLLFELGACRNGPRLADVALANCRSELIATFLDKRHTLLAAAGNYEAFMDYTKMLSSKSVVKAAAFERAIGERMPVANYLADVAEWLGCVEDQMLADKAGRLYLSKREGVLPQLEEIALRRFSRDMGIKPKVVQGMTDHPALLRKFIREYYEIPRENQEDIRAILRKCARKEKPGMLKESEWLFRNAVKDRELTIDPDCTVSKFSMELSAFNEERRREFLEARDDAALVCALAGLARTYMQLQRKAGDRIRLREPDFSNGTAQESYESLFKCVNAGIADAVEAGVCVPGELKVPGASEALGLGLDTIGRRLARNLGVKPAELEAHGGARGTPKVREALGLEKPENFEPLFAAVSSELEAADKFAENSMKASVVDYGVASMVGGHAVEALKRIRRFSPDKGGLGEMGECLRFSVIPRVEKPIDFLMLGNCRASCIRLDTVDGGKAMAEAELLKKLESLPEEMRATEEPKLSPVELVLVDHLSRRGLVRRGRGWGAKEVFELSEAGRDSVESNMKPDAYERAMIDYFLDWGTVGIMISTRESRSGPWKPVGHMVGHADYDGGLAVLGCNGFYFEQKHRSEANYLNAVRFAVSFAKRCGFNEYRHSQTELQDLEAKGFLANFRPFEEKPLRVSVKDELFFEYREYGTTWKIPSIATKPFKFIADFFMDDAVPGSVNLHTLCSNRPYLAVRLKADVNAERGKDAFSLLLENEDESYRTSVRRATRELPLLLREKYFANLSDPTGAEMDALLLRKIGQSKEARRALASAVEANLLPERRHLADRIAANFLSGKLVQWDTTKTNALLNALASGEYFFIEGGEAVPAARWIERNFPKAMEPGSSAPQVRGPAVRVKTGAGLVEIVPQSAEEKALVEAVEARLPEDRRGNAPAIVDNLLNGKPVQWSRRDTNALLEAVVNGPIFTYGEGRVSLKWLVERSYFGKPMGAKVEMRLFTPDEYDSLVAKTYDIFHHSGELDEAGISKQDFIELYRKRVIAILPEPNGVLIALNWRQVQDLMFYEALITVIHGIAHAQIGTAHLPDLPVGKNNAAEAVSEGFARSITLFALERADRLYPNSGFDVLRDQYLLRIDLEMDEDREAIQKHFKRFKELQPGADEDEFARHFINAKGGFIYARALRRNLDKKTFREEALPEIFTDVLSGKKDYDDVARKYLVPDRSALVQRLRADTEMAEENGEGEEYDGDNGNGEGA